MTEKKRDPIIAKWQGKRTDVECAAEMETPQRTYMDWVNMAHRPPRIVYAFIKLSQEFKRLKREINRLREEKK